MEIPRCCEREMKITAETVKFIETQCGNCGDVVYMKKSAYVKPQMLDD
jgi:hypothetical protein